MATCSLSSRTPTTGTTTPRSIACRPSRRRRSTCPMHRPRTCTPAARARRRAVRRSARDRARQAEARLRGGHPATAASRSSRPTAAWDDRRGGHGRGPARPPDRGGVTSTGTSTSPRPMGGSTCTTPKARTCARPADPPQSSGHWPTSSPRGTASRARSRQRPRGADRRERHRDQFGAGDWPDQLQPTGIGAFSSWIYVADTGNARVAVFNEDGEPRETWSVPEWVGTPTAQPTSRAMARVGSGSRTRPATRSCSP